MTNNRDRFRVFGALLLLSGVLVSTTRAQFNPNAPPPVNELQAKAEAGDAVAQRQLAQSYQAGVGVAKDPVKAAEWMLKAAQQDDLTAQYTMGTYYDHAVGVPRDMEKAAMWFRKAAERGVKNAQFNLATCYEGGDGVPKDLTQAMYWYEKAANQDDLEARTRLGVAYLIGEGVPRDPTKASGLFRTAAYRGYVDAMYHMGQMYRTGDGVVKDDAQATEWFKKAALGDQKFRKRKDAMYEYGMALHKGLGVGVDPTRARLWIERAAAAGSKPAKEFVAQNYAEPAATKVADAGGVSAAGTVQPEDKAATELPAAPANPGFKRLTQASENSFVSAPPGAAKAFAPAPAASSPITALTGNANAATAPTGGFSTEPVGAAPPTATAPPAPTAAPPAGGFSTEPATETGNIATAPTTTDAPPGFTSFGDGGASSAPAEKTPVSGGQLSGFEKMLAEATRKGRSSILGSNAVSSPPAATSTPSRPDNSGSFNSSPGGTMASSPGSLNTSPSSTASAPPTTTPDSAPATTMRSEPAPAPSSGGSGLDALARPPSTPVGNNQSAAFPVGLAYLTMLMAIAMVLISLMFFFTFKTRLHSLEGEIKKAQFELSKANVNLSSMMHQVEQLALQAPPERTDTAKEVVSLPEWDEVKSQTEAQNFKISRPR